MCTTAHATTHIHVLATSAVHDAPNRTMLTYVRCSTRCVWCWVMVASPRGHQTVNWRSSTAARAVRMGAAAMALVAPLLVALSARGMSPQRVVAAGNPCCLGAGQAQARVVLSCKDQGVSLFCKFPQPRPPQEGHTFADCWGGQGRLAGQASRSCTMK
jgi:hypothetical protein